MNAALDYVIKSYIHFYARERYCGCKPDTTDYYSIDSGDLIPTICHAHHWLDRQRDGHNALSSLSYCFPVPSPRLARMDKRTRATYNRAIAKAGLTPSNFILNPIEEEPNLIVIEYVNGVDSGAAAAQIAALLTKNFGNDKHHKGEHIVAYTNTTALYSARMAQKDTEVSDLLIYAPMLVVLNNPDGRTVKNDVFTLLYTRQYGTAVVINGEWK